MPTPSMGPSAQPLRSRARGSSLGCEEKRDGGGGACLIAKCSEGSLGLWGGVSLMALVIARCGLSPSYNTGRFAAEEVWYRLHMAHPMLIAVSAAGV